jgi:hypothetical protein
MPLPAARQIAGKLILRNARAREEKIFAQISFPESA